MQTLNLNTYTLENGNVTIDHFPDGQINIHLEGLDRKDGSVRIIDSLKNSDDIMLLLMAVDVIKRNGMTIEELHIPYLYAARMDRVMDFNQPFTLKIVADLINSIEAEFVYLYEVHNTEKTESLIKNVVLESPLSGYYHSLNKGTYIVFPDKGAKTRYEHYLRDNYICCSKVRDPKTNLLSGFTINEIVGNDTPTELRIIDDLCDGGGTFCGIAKMFKEKFPDVLITLVVTHLIQVSAIEKILNSGVSNIMTTNSYFNPDEVPTEYKDRVFFEEISYEE